MTEVEFHTGIADRIGFACRLLRKAYRQGARVLVTAPPQALNELDRALWSMQARDFLPHVRMPGSSASVAARTPIWLCTHAGTQGSNGAPVAEGAPRVLLNLGADAPESLQSLDRVIEVVSAEPDDADRGRGRWRAYKAAGMQVIHHGGTPTSTSRDSDSDRDSNGNGNGNESSDG